jgi:hypothetical protein
MTIHKLVSEFYGRVWNAGDRAALDELLSGTFTFQGSLGPEVAGREAFWQIVSSVPSGFTTCFVVRSNSSTSCTTPSIVEALK